MTSSGHKLTTDEDAQKNVSRFLRASAVQIEAATSETREEIENLTQLVIALAQHASTMNRRLDRFSELNLAPEDLAGIRGDITSLDAAANKTIARLQFADRMHQRLTNVQTNLDALAVLIGEKTMSPKRWSAFLEESRATFTMEHERSLFDSMVGGRSDDESANDSIGDNIALFEPVRGDGDAG